MKDTLYRAVAVVTVVICVGCSKQEQASSQPAEKSSQEIAATTPAAEGTTMADYEKLEAEALRGDYQAQRNVSYWLSGGLGVPPINPILGCAWRIAILNSGSLSVDQSDSSNKAFYCNKRLTSEELLAAEAQAETLIETIEKSKPK
ncbi:MAG: hypothetical protein WAW61_16455 [Methylococcaceae bacterium]